MRSIKMKTQKLQLDKINTNHIMDDKKYTLLDSEKQPTGEFTGIELKKSNLLFTVGDDKLFLIDDSIYDQEQGLILKGYKNHYEKNNTLYITDNNNDTFKVKRNANYFQNDIFSLYYDQDKPKFSHAYSNVIGENISLLDGDNFVFSYKKQFLVLNTETKTISEYSLNNEIGKKLWDLPGNISFDKDSPFYIKEDDNFLYICFVKKRSNQDIIHIFSFNRKTNTNTDIEIILPVYRIPTDPNIIASSIIQTGILDLTIKDNIVKILFFASLTKNPEYGQDFYNNIFYEYEYNISGSFIKRTTIMDFSDIDFPSGGVPVTGSHTKGESIYVFFSGKYIDNMITIAFKGISPFVTVPAARKWVEILFFNTYRDYQLISSHYDIRKLKDTYQDDDLTYKDYFESYKISLNENYFLFSGIVKGTEKEYYNESKTFNPNYPANNKLNLPSDDEVNKVRNEEIDKNATHYNFEFGEEIPTCGKKITLSLGLEYLLGKNDVFCYYFISQNIPYWFLQLPKFFGKKNLVINLYDKDKVFKSRSYTAALKHNDFSILYTPVYDFSEYKLATEDNATPEKPIGSLLSDYVEIGVSNAREISIFTETARGNAVIFKDDNKVCQFLDHNNQLHGVFHGESEEIIDISSIKDGTFIATNSKLLLQTVIGTNAIEYYNQEINIGYDVTAIGDKIICYYSDNILKYVYENSIVEMLYPLNSPPKKVIKKKNCLLLQDMKNRIWIITPKERIIALLSLSEEKIINLDHLIKDDENNMYALEKGTCKFRFSYSRGTSPIVLKKVSSYSKIIKAMSLLECKNSRILNVVHWRDKFTIPCSIALNRDRTIQINFDERLGNEITIEYI